MRPVPIISGLSIKLHALESELARTECIVNLTFAVVYAR